MMQTDISLTNVHPGDTVTVRRHYGSGEIATIIGIVSHDFLVGGATKLRDSQNELIDHQPAEPEWLSALAVKDAKGFRWGHTLDGWQILGNQGDSIVYPADDVAANAPITVLIDGDGNAVASSPATHDGNEPNKTPLAIMADQVWQVNVDKGWRGPNAPARSFGDEIALLHSEVSEALEAYRVHGFTEPESHTVFHTNGGETVPKPEGVPAELADVLIRLLDICENRDVDLNREFQQKLAFNRLRPYRHGGKRL